ncbi:MAG TPA: serine/threonine protein kinase [Sedimenticola thiotaurini]|uniref:Serine/threonine protein kinase n=1 Tax=Sedimenticola thiotaurini TaxID=1543721 RepID=A0A831RK31_9GAMM|nr:serine/threonine protein kinase [Sedimenticola thiotaurini]
MGSQEIPFTIPGYRIDRILGKGGMATVYLGTQMSLGRPVALKILHDPETPQFFERFFNEGRCVARLSHTSLVTIFDIGQGDGFYYIVMEYLPGGDLKSRIRGGIKPGQALKILARLANCLGYVHDNGVVHRDIKPSNVLFRADDTPVLTDFGIAKLIQADNDLTVTGTVMGSPHYLSPEQAQGSRRLDGRSDLYSLGVILFEMLTGRKPYSADGFAATLMAHIRQPVPQLPEHLQQLQPLIDRLLAKQPEERFQSGAELVQGIKHLRSTAIPKGGGGKRHSRSPPPARPAPPGWRQLAMGAGAAVAAAVLSLAFLGGEDAPATPPTVTAITPPMQALATIGITPAVAVAATPPSTPPPPEAAPSRPQPEGEETAPPVESAEVAAWLEKADQRYREDRLGLPAGDSARYWYRRVLEREPDNAAARAGLRRVARRYARLARNRLREGDLGRARRFTEQGLKTLPGDGDLLALARELERRQLAARAPKPVRPNPRPARRPPAVVAREAEPDPFALLNPGDR